MKNKEAETNFGECHCCDALQVEETVAVAEPCFHDDEAVVGGMCSPSAPSEEELARAQEEEELGPAYGCDDEEEVARAVAESREASISLIRDHATGYLTQNPNASYITWIATLHPENAEVTIDPRFLNPGNPWWTVYEEAMTVTRLNSSIDETSDGDGTTPATTSQTHPERRQEGEEDCFSYKTLWCYGGLVPLIVGFCMIVSASFTTLTLQCISVICYVVVVCCDRICTMFRSVLNVCTILPFGFFWIILNVFRFFDLLLLLTDIIVVEALAAVCYLCCGVLGGFSHYVGLSYHQQTRRLAHLVRWASRMPFRACHPPRAYVGTGVLEESLLGDANANEETRYVAIHDRDDDSSDGGIP